MAASSVIVIVGESTADVVASSAVVLAFNCTLIVFAIRNLPPTIQVAHQDMRAKPILRRSNP